MTVIKERKSLYAPMSQQEDAMAKIGPLDFWALFMEQGTGKSKVVLMKAKRLYDEGKIDRLVVIAPSTVKDQWTKEVLEEHCELEYLSINYRGMHTVHEKEAFREMLNDNHRFKVFVVHYEAFLTKGLGAFLRMFTKEGYPLVVADESTKIKGNSAQRTEKILKGFAKRKYKGILSGTPTPHSPVDLYSQFEFLKKGFWGMTYWQFERRYCLLVTKVNPTTGRQFSTAIDETVWWLVHQQIDSRIAERIRNGQQTDTKPREEDFDVVSAYNHVSFRDCMEIYRQEEYTPYKNLQEVYDKIEPYTYSVLKEDCMDLPPKVHEKLYVDLTPEQKRLIKELKKDLIATYDGLTLTASNVVSAIGRQQMITGGLFPHQEIKTTSEGLIDYETRYERMSKNPKLDALIQDLEEVPTTTSIIVWAKFTEELRWAYERLKEAGESVALYIGETTELERSRIEADFKAKKIRILCISPKLGEMGLNFQVATQHYFLSNDYMADQRLQAEDRSHRKGQENKVLYKDIIARNSRDQLILDIIRRGEDLINYFRRSPDKLSA